MEKLRKPFQGITNIVRFNWHFYAAALVALIVGFILIRYSNMPEVSRLLMAIVLSTMVLMISISLIVSSYIYDFSNLYKFSWLDNVQINRPQKIMNIHAGFDETSYLLKKKFPQAQLCVFDFYDPSKHTELSIHRARRAYPPFPDTEKMITGSINRKNHSIDLIFLILSAHEIRNTQERALFFKDLQRILHPNGKIIVVEHLRDLSNFLAYTVGFLHFFSEKSWRDIFQYAQLRVVQKFKITPFIHTFILTSYGNPS
jgi:ubiquinone/menaquinone biosynthesis C-methylase UbiE